MIDTLTALRNDPDNEELQKQAARELYEQPQNLTPALVQAVPEIAATVAEVKQAVTVVEAKITAVAGDLESAATVALKGVEGAVEGALGSVAPAAVPPVLAAPATLALADLPTPGRVAWKNYVATQKAQPLTIEKPGSLDELLSVMQLANKMNCRVRAVGSGHSWSDSALTDGIIVETHGLNKELPLDTLKASVDPTTLYATEAGVVLQDLIDALKTTNRALINMGGYAGQTLAGVISTSTHGSGLKLGSFSSMVRSLVVVTAQGTVLQIEPSDGITDQTKFAAQHPTWTLKQDDDLFRASVVGVGCLGIIYAATIEVMGLYYLEETRKIYPWHDVKAMLLKPGPDNILNQYRHVEVLFNPHKVPRLTIPPYQNYCLLTLRNIVPPPPPSQTLTRGQSVFEDLVGKITEAALALLFNSFPKLSPELLQISLDVLAMGPQPHTNVYNEILNIGAANSFPAVSAEYGLDLDKAVPAVDAILDAAAHYQKSGIYHSSPAAMRWVAPSPGYLSMQPVTTCMIEMPNLLGVYGYPDIYFRYETMLVQQFGARPHWGQMNFLNGSPGLIQSLYPNVGKFLSVFQGFNTQGRFSSVFTNRVGFSSEAP